MAPRPPYLLAIDQGTTSTRAILFDRSATPIASHAVELRQIYPANGWVEHDPEEIWHGAMVSCEVVLRGINLKDVAGIGIANQRETTVLWERDTGAAVHNAIVWQDRRTSDRCEELRKAGWESDIANQTGLLLDPYFSATKLEWLLDHVPGSRKRAERGDLAFGTIDSWLVYRLTRGRMHATDVTNASRTMLFDLRTLDWSVEMLRLFNVPEALLPEVRDCADDYGATASDVFGSSVPIRGMAGDQQAAFIGQACFSPGDVKATYGTGCFALVNTGGVAPASRNRLLVTCGFRVNGKKAYAMEGSIFAAGAVVQWLRDALGCIRNAGEVEALARTAKQADGLYFVPAFTGLGAPYWNSAARGAITGLTRDAGAAEIARAALDSACYQSRDLLEAMAGDMAAHDLAAPRLLKVDGGMVRNNWFCQRLADLTGLVVQRPTVTETTALGAAYLVGLGARLFSDFSAVANAWTLDRRFEPEISSMSRDALYEGWRNAVARAVMPDLVGCG